MGRLILFAGILYLLYRFVYQPLVQKNALLQSELERERLAKHKEETRSGRKEGDFADYEEIE